MNEASSPVSQDISLRMNEINSEQLNLPNFQISSEKRNSSYIPDSLKASHNAHNHCTDNNLSESQAYFNERSSDATIAKQKVEQDSQRRNESQTPLLGQDKKELHLFSENPLRVRLPIQTLLNYYFITKNALERQKKNLVEPLISLVTCTKSQTKTTNEIPQQSEQNYIPNNSGAWNSASPFPTNTDLNRRSSTVTNSGVHEKEQISVQDTESSSRRQKRPSCSEAVFRGRGRGFAFDNPTSASTKVSNFSLRGRSSRTHQPGAVETQQDAWKRNAEGEGSKQVSSPAELSSPIWRRKDIKQGGNLKSDSSNTAELQNFRKTSQTPVPDILSVEKKHSPDINKPFVDSLLGVTYSEANMPIFNNFSKLERVPDRRRCLQAISHNQQKINDSGLTLDETPGISQNLHDLQKDNGTTIKNTLVQTEFQEASKTEPLGGVTVFPSPEFSIDSTGLQEESTVWLPPNEVPNSLSIEQQRPLYSLFTEQPYGDTVNDIPVKGCSFLLNSLNQCEQNENVTNVKSNFGTSLFPSTLQNQLYKENTQPLDKVYNEEFSSNFHNEGLKPKTTNGLSKCAVTVNLEKTEEFDKLINPLDNENQKDLNELLRQIRQSTQKEVLQTMTAAELLDKLQNACNNNETFKKTYENETVFDPTFELPETVAAISDCLVSQVLATREISKQKQVGFPTFHPFQSWNNSIKILDTSLDEPQPKTAGSRYACNGSQPQQLPPPPPSLFDEQSGPLPSARFDTTAAQKLPTSQMLINNNEENPYDETCRSCHRQKQSVVPSPFLVLHKSESCFQNKSSFPSDIPSLHLDTEQSVMYPVVNESINRIRQNNNLISPSPSVNGGSSEHSKYVHPRTNDILLQMQQDSHDNQCIDEHPSLYTDSVGTGDKSSALKLVPPIKDDLLLQNHFLWKSAAFQKNADYKTQHNANLASHIRENIVPGRSMSPVITDVPPKLERPAFPLEKAIWEYKDLNGQIQGLFTSLQMKTWFDGNFFLPDLLMRYSSNMPFVPFCFLYPPQLYDNYPPFLDYPRLPSKEELDFYHELNQETDSKVQTLPVSSNPQQRNVTNMKMATQFQPIVSDVNQDKKQLQTQTAHPHLSQTQQQMSRAAIMTHDLRAMLRIGQHDNESNTYQSMIEVEAIKTSASNRINADTCSGFAYTSENPDSKIQNYNPSSPSSFQTVPKFYDSEFPSCLKAPMNQSVVSANTALSKTQRILHSDVEVSQPGDAVSLHSIQNTSGLKAVRDKKLYTVNLKSGKKLLGFNDKPNVQNFNKHRSPGPSLVFSNGVKPANSTTKSAAAAAAAAASTDIQTTYLLKAQGTQPPNTVSENPQDRVRTDETAIAASSSCVWNDKEECSKRPKTWKVLAVTSVVNDNEFIEPSQEHSVSQTHKGPKLTKFSSVAKLGHESKKTTRTLQDFIKYEVKQNPPKSAWNKAVSVVPTTYDFVEDTKVSRPENFHQVETQTIQQVPDSKRRGTGSKEEQSTTEIHEFVSNTNSTNKLSNNMNCNDDSNDNSQSKSTGNYVQDSDVLEHQSEPTQAWITVSKKKIVSIEKQHKQQQTLPTVKTSPVANKLQVEEQPQQSACVPRSLITSIQKALATCQISMPEQSILELCENYKTRGSLLEYLTPYVMNESKANSLVNVIVKLIQTENTATKDVDLTIRNTKQLSKKSAYSNRTGWNNVVLGTKDNNLNTHFTEVGEQALAHEPKVNKTEFINNTAKQTGITGHRPKRVVKGKVVDPSLLGFSVRSNRIMQGVIDRGEQLS